MNVSRLLWCIVMFSSIGGVVAHILFAIAARLMLNARLMPTLDPTASLSFASVHPSRDGILVAEYSIVGDSQIVYARMRLYPWGSVTTAK